MASTFDQIEFPDYLPRDIIDIIKSYCYRREDAVKRCSEKIYTGLNTRFINTAKIAKKVVNHLDKKLDGCSAKALDEKFWEILVKFDVCEGFKTFGLFELLYIDDDYAPREYEVTTLLIGYIVGDDPKLINIFLESDLIKDLEFDYRAWIAIALIFKLGYLPKNDVKYDRYVRKYISLRLSDEHLAGKNILDCFIECLKEYKYVMLTHYLSKSLGNIKQKFFNILVEIFGYNPDNLTKLSIYY